MMTGYGWLPPEDDPPLTPAFESVAWWPRCGRRFVNSPDDARAGRWRRCTRPWGHWLARHARHDGPLI